ncbi:Bifunctional inhibitor/plant lipid transfer protein/seed storage helical domain containing protein [Trema orientale]|uniref:Bifunctional inhibitor/plant lipid transfer protein/seed storage helical domain containing protein n=1 Tax=Trema orientale TaxID=63057 RepID=A0A2P5BAU5_TREOI|nr:Bifunctional inhibitor/plant lipid transfer protein/seed storage helical domain containing protein [Trema orientale]
MASNINACFVLMFLLVSNAFLWDVDAAGECGRTPIRSAAASLSPCLSAAGNAGAKVPPACCAKVGALIKSAPRCLCAVLLSPLAKQAGIKPGIAITIPKRCDIKNRPAGKKCGSKLIFVLRYLISCSFSKFLGHVGFFF